MNKKIVIVSGARPNFPKVAPVIAALADLPRASRPKVVHVHTGQHYDFLLSQVFFDELRMPAPDHYLNAGSGSHGRQTAAMMIAFERVLQAERPALVVVVGDVNSTLACALAATKLGIAVAHVEAGLRCGDQSMPEEINRVLTDQLAGLLFTHSREAGENLLRDGRPTGAIHYVGNVMIDSLRHALPQAARRPLLRGLGLEPEGEMRPYALVTLHRPTNVDHRQTFKGIIRALKLIAREMPVVYPAHPRAWANVKKYGLADSFIAIKNIASGRIGDRGLYLTAPLGYLDFIRAEMCAACVLTDSGGVQEETTWLGVPCLTIRDSTERPVTVEVGTNMVAGTSYASIINAWRVQRQRRATPLRVPPKWDGRSAPRIAILVAQALRHCENPLT